MFIWSIRVGKKHLGCCYTVNKYPLASSPFRNAKCVSSCCQPLSSLAVLEFVQISIIIFFFLLLLKSEVCLLSVWGDKEHFCWPWWREINFESLWLLNFKLETQLQYQKNKHYDWLISVSGSHSECLSYKYSLQLMHGIVILLSNSL